MLKRQMVNLPLPPQKKQLLPQPKRELSALQEKQQDSAGTAIANTAAMVGAQPREGELMYDVVNKLDEARPLQSMTTAGYLFWFDGVFRSHS